MKTFKFASVAKLGDAVALTAIAAGFTSSDCGHETKEQVIERCHKGNARLVKEAEKQIGKYMVDVATDRMEWAPDVCGAFPVVPDVLSGFPDNMRRRVHRDSDAAPLAVYVNVGMSHAVSAQETATRGTAVLALVLGLSRVRPISLWVFSAALGMGSQSAGHHGEETMVAAQVNTTPLDVATAAYALTSAGFARRAIFGVVANDQKYAGFLGWPRGWNADRGKWNAEVIRELGGPRDALILDPAFSGDAILRDTEAWLKDQLAKFSGNSESAA